MSDVNYTYRAKITRVIDGDTYQVDVDLGFYIRLSETVRLLNVNCYETTLRGSTTSEEKVKGIACKEFMTKLMTQYPDVIIKTTRSTDSFGRWLAEMWIPDYQIDDIRMLMPVETILRTNEWLKLT